MITVFTLSQRKGCRDAIDHLVKHNLPFIERKLHHEPLTMDELCTMLTYTHDEGTYEILSEHSKEFKRISAELEAKGMTFDDLKLSELHAIVKQFPRIIKTPIILDGKQMTIGFSEDIMTTIIPRSIRLAHISNNLEIVRAIEDAKLQQGEEISQGHWGRQGGWGHEVFA